MINAATCAHYSICIKYYYYIFFYTSDLNFGLIWPDNQSGWSVSQRWSIMKVRWHHCNCLSLHLLTHTHTHTNTGNPKQYTDGCRRCEINIREINHSYHGSQWSGWIPTEYLSTASASDSFSSSYVSSQMTRARYLRDLYSCWWRHACKKHVMASTPVFMFLNNTNIGRYRVGFNIALDTVQIFSERIYPTDCCKKSVC